MAEHTPLPWDYVPSTEHHGPYITSDHGGTIADLYTMSDPGHWSTAAGGKSKPISFFHEMADPNAELIVRAVNSHDVLVRALEAITKEVGTSTLAYKIAVAALASVSRQMLGSQE